MLWWSSPLQDRCVSEKGPLRNEFIKNGGARGYIKGEERGPSLINDHWSKLVLSKDIQDHFCACNGLPFICIYRVSQKNLCSLELRRHCVIQFLLPNGALIPNCTIFFWDTPVYGIFSKMRTISKCVHEVNMDFVLKRGGQLTTLTVNTRAGSSAAILSFCLSVTMVCLPGALSVWLTFWHPVDILNNFCFDN